MNIGVDFMAGLLGGVFSSLPIGPINLMVLDLSLQKKIKQLIVFICGVLAADLILAALSVWGFTWHRVSPEYAIYLALACSIILIFYAASSWSNARNKNSTQSKANGYGIFAAGFLFCLMNPLFSVFWLTYVASYQELVRQEAVFPFAFVAGVGAGDVIWFSFLAIISHIFLANRNNDFIFKLRRINSVVILIFAIAILVAASRGL